MLFLYCTMRTFLLLVICSLFLAPFAVAQVIEQPTLYMKMVPLVKTYQGVKIKWLMANYKKNEIVVATKKSAITLNKQQAREAGIIAPAPEVKEFTIDSCIYNGIINLVNIKNIDTLKEKIVSDDASVYFDPVSQQYKVEVYLPDTAAFYSVDKETLDTVGICRKEISQLPDDEAMQPAISFGDIDNKLVTPELLQQQKMIRITGDYTFISAVVYFAGGNFTNVYMRSLQSKSLSGLQRIVDSCIEGTTIIFDNVIVQTRSGKLMRALMPAITIGKFARTLDLSGPVFQFGSIKADRAESGRFKRQKKLYVSNGYEFVSAKLYFTGAGFPEVNEIFLSGPSLAPAYPMLQKCQPGSVVIFDNVKIKTPKDGIRTILGNSYALF